MHIDALLAPRTSRMDVSAIREILKVVAQPGMVSLAGGIPSPDSFPLGLLDELTGMVLQKYGPRAFQYDATEGFGPLREALVDHLAARGVPATAGDILIATGSQGVLDALGKVVIGPGDLVAVEAPTYLGALQAFNPYEPRYTQIATDDDGLIPASLAEVLARAPVKLVYLAPTFQNPTGRTLPLARRRQVADIIQRHDVLLVEDDPYSDLRYRGEPVAPLKSLAPDHVIYIGTLSKTFAPGLRLGYTVAPPVLLRWLVIAKQGVDLHTSTYNQALAAEYLGGGYLQRHLPRIIEIYGPRQAAMLAALARSFPPTFTWSRPEGGMFIWVEGPPGFDAEAAYWRAIERKTAFVPGKFFYAQPGDGLATLRLNFTMADEATIERAVGVLGEIVSTAVPPAQPTS
ncbi:MAG: PLP-dependent aminotransferase family protein [Chloroflexi bacterium]|nr:PLP-dependent aminotransferase family protein [Chloroflexota bacterium]